jgi:iron complex outermembrane receptor protein
MSGHVNPMLASAAVLAGVVGAALAQEPPEAARTPVEIPKIEVIGSNIPRADAASALPVQILTRDDILRSGATTTPELLSTISANILGINDQLGIGDTVRPGLASANLRGIGDGSTLVLLNGRRVANYAFQGGAVDLNTIPLAAIDRVEILKDGASAIYGSDAIGGIINFVLRKNFRGLEATGYGAWTEHGGADSREAIVSAGYGDLAADRFNVFATMSYRKSDALRAIQRSFASTGYIPSEGINQLSGASFPANIQVSPGPPPLLANPAFAAGCAPPASIPVSAVSFLSTGPFCAYDYPTAIDIVPPVERTSIVGRATLQLNGQQQLFAEATYASDRFVFRNAPTPILMGPASSTQAIFYPVAGPYYPAQFAAANGLTGDLDLRWRPEQLGPQTDATDSKASRVVVGTEGSAEGWRYDSALAYSENRQTDRFVSGYVSQTRMVSALATGLINPFGPSGPDGDALVASTQVLGNVHDAKGSSLGVDLKASREIYPLPAGPLAIALGGEARREKLENRYAPVWTSGDVLGVGGSHESASGSRSAAALFVEGIVPLAEGLEAQAAARYDHYSDFGGTTNPKVALRWQPARPLLLRTSWGTGFRVPTLYDLFTPLSRGSTAGAKLEDPVRCPVTGSSTDCPGNSGGAFVAAFGGNSDLQPEKSEQFNAGIVWEPATGLSLSADYWKIDQSHVIGSLNAAVVFAHYDRYASTNIIRGPVDPNFPGLPGPIQTVLLNEQNLGDLRTSGIDLAANWRGARTPIGTFRFVLDGSYVLSWEEQLDGVAYTSGLARKAAGIAGPVPRWKHHATLDWEYGPWGATIAQTYQAGYLDANVDKAGNLLPVPPRSVASYDVWDLQLRCSGFSRVTIAFGVKNLMDRAPPFSNQTFTRQVGYDPAYADPRGRTYYTRLTIALE